MIIDLSRTEQLSTGESNTHFRPRKFSVSIGKLLTILAVIIVCSATPSYAQLPTVEVSDVTKVMAEQSSAVKSYKADLHLIVQDSEFLKEFFWDPDTGKYMSSASLYGKLKSAAPGNANVYIKYKPIEYQSFVISGDEVSYSGLLRFNNINKNLDKYQVLKYTDILSKKPAEPSPTPTPSKVEENSSNTHTPDSATPDSEEQLADPMAPPGSYVDLTPYQNGSTHAHPLNFISPYILHPRDPSCKLSILSDSANLFGSKCVLLKIEDEAHKYITRVWIDLKRKQVRQVEATNLYTKCTLTATYLGYYSVQKGETFSLYNRVQVNCNGAPLYMAEISNPVMDFVQKEERARAEKEKTKVGYQKQFSDYLPEAVRPLLNSTSRNIVIILSLVLSYLVFRFVLYRMSRQEFSDQLIVIDEEDGRFAEMLNKMGYRTLPFTPELVTEERNFLGKGPTEDTSYRPRAIVVAPDSFQFVHNYLFLIRAYVEEGGRVLVMYHPQKSNADLPYVVEQMPLPKENQGILFDYKSDTLTNVKADYVKQLAKLYTGPESCLSVNGKKFNERLLWCTRKDTGVESTIVGMKTQGKGEYIVCQMQFSTAATIKSANMQFLLNDIFRYLLALEPIKTNN